MFTLLLVISILMVLGKLVKFTLEASWTVFKVFMYIFFLPVILIVFIAAGLIYIALPIILIAGIISLVTG
ncbi:MAG: hypothetical protein IJ821_07890 [Lachnospiraceae bacterium]|nr:hypothetical protein [Lachnospiraceae bacterium]